MVYLTRLLGKRLRLANRRWARPPISGATSGSRYPKTSVVLERLYVERTRDEETPRGSALTRRRGMEGSHVREHLRELAEIFPGAHVVQE